MENVIYLVLAASVLALGFAFFFYKRMLKADEGTDLMKKIALYVRRGAMAYLKQQYKVVIIVFIILAAIFGVMSILAFRTAGCGSHSSPAVSSPAWLVSSE